MEREVLDVDLLIVGAGPAGLSAALRFAQKWGEATKKQDELNIAVIEKSAVLGEHILSGAVFNPVSLYELLPGYKDMFSIYKEMLPQHKEMLLQHKEMLPIGKEMSPPFEAPVIKDDICFLTKNGQFRLPFIPPSMQNHGNYIMSLNKFVVWLGEIVEKSGVNIFPGFPGQEILYDGNKVIGIRTGDKGIDKQGQKKTNFEPGVDIHAKITIFAEGARGSLTKILVEKLNLDRDKNPEGYATGVKEVWEVPAGRIEPGQVIHTMGYPLDNKLFGGGFIYGMANNHVSLGFVVSLDCEDPLLDPHEIFQRFKTHPFVLKLLQGGKMIKYGAKAIPEGGYYAIPNIAFDGGMIVGDSAGLVNVPKLKGIHYAMKSGMLAAETAFLALEAGDFSRDRLKGYESRLNESFVGKELYETRNFKQSFKQGFLQGLLVTGIIFATKGAFPQGRMKTKEDHQYMKQLKEIYQNSSPRAVRVTPDGQLTYNKLTDVYFSGTKHEENQPVHLLVSDLNICSTKCKEEYGNPCQYFCPAQVYEIENGQLKINASNCVHCKTCDIKDPYGIITWVPPEGGGGPSYIGL